MLKKKILIAVLSVCGISMSAEGNLPLIPQPAQITTGTGTFVFGKKLTTYAPSYPGDSIACVLDRFAENFTHSTGIKTKKAKASRAKLEMKTVPSMGAEAYRLTVQPEKILIEAARPAGFFYALQTLKQLLPARTVMAGAEDNDTKEWTLPVVTITDEPRFAWRGFMLDEGRHFFGMEEIKRVLDVMAAYKMNRFHWHLTEDQGWRIEIKKYPRLTEVGAWRNSMVLPWGDVKADGKHYGGYYTQDDAREIVAYARERFIEIVPEIDIPGHSQAAVAAYPEFLACDPERPHGVWVGQGVSADVINVSNPKAVQFAKDVIDELAGVFPFGYLHLGGDECPTSKWEKNEQCRKQLEKIGSKNFRDLQINFYRQLKEHIANKPASQQKQLIFWNEVLHGNTASLGTDITIMAWIGANRAAQEAAKRDMTVILTPQIPYYINRKQSKLPSEPLSQGHGTETVEAVYNYMPMHDVPAGLQPKYMGVQANFWTEWVEDASKLEYLMLPRLAAVAEAGWTPQELRSYSDFEKRLQTEAQYYNAKGLNYGKHVFSGEKK